MSSLSAFEAPWIEKYRPEYLRDIVGNAEAVSRLSAIATVGNLPNIILAGPPGIGLLCPLYNVFAHFDQEKQQAFYVLLMKCWGTRTRARCSN
jgi:replication-associated recombination protein RarA